MSKLKDAFDAVSKKCGRDLAEAMCNCFGSRGQGIADVPRDRQDGLTTALLRLANGDGSLSMTMGSAIARGDRAALRKEAGLDDDDDDAFAAIRASAFGERSEATQRPKPATKLDPVAIYDRWNNPTRDREDD